LEKSLESEYKVLRVAWTGLIKMIKQSPSYLNNASFNQYLNQ